MDPNETLTRLRGHVEAVQTRVDLYHESHGAEVVGKLNNDDLYAIHEAFTNLDSWMTDQNTPPTAWMPDRPAVPTRLNGYPVLAAVPTGYSKRLAEWIVVCERTEPQVAGTYCTWRVTYHADREKRFVCHAGRYDIATLVDATHDMLRRAELVPDL